MHDDPVPTRVGAGSLVELRADAGADVGVELHDAVGDRGLSVVQAVDEDLGEPAVVVPADEQLPADEGDHEQRREDDRDPQVDDETADRRCSQGEQDEPQMSPQDAAEVDQVLHVLVVLPGLPAFRLRKAVDVGACLRVPRCRLRMAGVEFDHTSPPSNCGMMSIAMLISVMIAPSQILATIAYRHCEGRGQRRKVLQ